MALNENMVQDIVKEVLAKMQISEAPVGKHGVFADMNEAIEAAKKSQQIPWTRERRSSLSFVRKLMRMQKFLLAWALMKLEWVM